MKHIHADLMAEYAKDAQETDKPWERWEYMFTSTCTWEPCTEAMIWSKHARYRRKPKTININGFEVPEPVREQKGLDDFETYYVVDFEFDRGFFNNSGRWEGGHSELKYLKKGLIHLTKEAAELHAKALLSFTEIKS
jgi:hypothetical protein